jgi:hypothetical protein
MSLNADSHTWGDACRILREIIRSKEAAMKEPEVNEEFSGTIAELVTLIQRLPPERQEQLRRELEAGASG